MFVPIIFTYICCFSFTKQFAHCRSQARENFISSYSWETLSRRAPRRELQEEIRVRKEQIAAIAQLLAAQEDDCSTIQPQLKLYM